MVDLIRKSVSTGELKVSTQLKSKLCVVGCGVALKNFEGIIERYSSMPQNCQLDDFDVYADGTLNAIIYEAIKSYLFDLNIFTEYTEEDVVETFRLSYGVTSKIITSAKDLWKFICATMKTISIENEEDYLQKDIVFTNIFGGILVFLLSNVEHPNYKRFRKDLIRLEEYHLEQPDSFLPYLWKEIIEYVAQSRDVIQEQNTGKIEHTTTSETESTHTFPSSPFKNVNDAVIWKERLIHFYGNKINIPLNCSKYNHILRCLVWFMEEWDKQGLLIKQPNRAAIQFLVETCGFKRDGVSVYRIAGVLGDLRKMTNELCEERELVRKYMERIVKNT